MRNVELMLSLGRIHGDLSAYNVLYWQGEVKIIDFPQAIEPATNPGVYHFKSGLGGQETSTPGPFQAAPAGMCGSLMPSAEKFYRWTRRFAKWT